MSATRRELVFLRECNDHCFSGLPEQLTASLLNLFTVEPWFTTVTIFGLHLR